MLWWWFVHPWVITCVVVVLGACQSSYIYVDDGGCMFACQL